MLKTVLCYTSILGILVIVTFGSFFWLPAPIQYQVTERYLLAVGGESSQVNLGVLIPINGPYQAVEDIHINWGAEIERKRHISVDRYQLSGKIAAGEFQEVVIDYKITVKHGLILWQNPVEDYQLAPQDLIESDHPDIQEAAAKITTGNSWVDSYNIYAYTSGYLTQPGERQSGDWRYGDWQSAGPDNKSALYAYYSRRGSCGEYARLMVALNRASGIAAKQVSGILLPDLAFQGSSTTQNKAHPAEAHAWVEFYTPLGWSLADPSCGSHGWKIFQFARSDGRHVAFGGADLEGQVYREMWLWALRNGTLLDSQFSAFKYVLSADSVQVSMTPSVSITNYWDGRWLNTVLATALATILLRGLLQKTSKQHS